MSFNFERARTCLQAGDLRGLFVQEIGWDHPNTRLLPIEDRGVTYRLEGVASTKEGRAHVWKCTAPDGTLPDHATRLRIDTRLSEQSIEHVIVFTTATGDQQAWVWVRRATRFRPRAVRTHVYRRGQSGEALLQKLQGLFLSIDDEPGRRVGNEWLEEVFDTEPVTKRFYQEFSRHRNTFEGHITGITDDKDRAWYASVMLNRLMFTWFIQKKRFLDDNPNYLPDKLKEVQRTSGLNQFQNFYRTFLLRLFHEGLGKPATARATDCDALFGRVPYLNGGIFDVHQLESPERYGVTIQIDDRAFIDIFSFFDRYQWHLDDRPVKHGNEINPDVLGYIFEKYINQKEMGAYYTKEDITEYISKSAIMSRLLLELESRNQINWSYLSENPDRYIFTSVLHGVDVTLSDEITNGLSADYVDIFDKRLAWNRESPRSHGLPDEIWRETLERHRHVKELRRVLSGGKISSVEEFLQYNLNVRQFFQDIIDRCENLAFLVDLWSYLSGLTILDPTGGSGAFLFAALNILEPLYDSCADRIDCILNSDNNSDDLISESSNKARVILSKIDHYHNRRYFILKSIILQNLYAVDIMEEAVEICKLRLFLKLISQVRLDNSMPNLGIEPLPDVDFNIYAGNTLVGYTSFDDIESALSRQFDFSGMLEQIHVEAELISGDYKLFRDFQTANKIDGMSKQKHTLKVALASLESKLDMHLAAKYGINNVLGPEFTAWKATVKPFHWWSRFFHVMSKGGFDIIIGNPPYLENHQVQYSIMDLKSLSTGAIHAMCIERSIKLLTKNGTLSMIVPLSIISSQRMQLILTMLQERFVPFYINFSWRPGKLFDNVNRALTIITCLPPRGAKVFSTRYQQWNSSNRSVLFEQIRMQPLDYLLAQKWIPKLSSNDDLVIYNKLLMFNDSIEKHVKKTGSNLYYRSSGGLYWKIFTDFQPYFSVNGITKPNQQQANLIFADLSTVRKFIAVLSSSTFWWWYVTTSNVRHLTPFNIFSFPLSPTIISNHKLEALAARLLEDLISKSRTLTRHQKSTGSTVTQSFVMRESKHIIDLIDYELARHYDFTAHEIDYIVNFDVKLRSNLEQDD